MTAVATAAVAGSASAAMIPASLVELETESTVTVTFDSSDAGAKGSLYFLGHEQDGSITYATSTDANGLGKWLFSNHGTAPGYSVNLGTLPGGALLHFAYLITNGVSVAPTGSLFRTDVPDDMLYFMSDVVAADSSGTTVSYGIEDIRNPSKSDWDYNDVMFSVRVDAIPGPGAIALAASAVMLAGVRRRRRAD
ncbi:MAG: hypothetical protein EA380_01435 [Phycisphaeraceae bacterium]|nr:MAG: hypothetical protein EA380_01435 [Phycisphaeraceae bacterium]